MVCIDYTGRRESLTNTCLYQDPNDPSNVQELQQYCGGYMEDGVEKPYLLKDGTPGPWSKGFICQEGLVCQVRIWLR